MLIDFSELRTGEVLEAFARCYLERLGFRIIQTFSYGADGGVDLIVEEPSIFRDTVGRFWLVSCKNTTQARSQTGRRVGRGVEEFSGNDLIEHGCHGFVGMYPTGITKGLFDKIHRHCGRVRFPYKIIQGDEMAVNMVSDPYFYPLLRNYFPYSYGSLMNPRDTDCCQECGKPFYSPNLVFDYERGFDETCCSDGRFLKYGFLARMNTVEVNVICDECYEKFGEAIQVYGEPGVALAVLEAPSHWGY